MSYEVLARKWRPQTFKEVVGQDHVVQTLRNAIESGRVAHAYLFVGPRGTGKTSTARILAKALNCEDGPTVDFDPESDVCKEIAAGNSLDVIEIDGASNNSVDQVRDLRESVGYAPARSRFKIYIIDEVHMLSIAAFNALLKTLEEPPAHVKFMFATTEPQKVPATILSRCQRFDLRRISAVEIVEKLREICGAEKVKIDDAALLAIARGAEGGLRDAESALDQIIAFKGKDINEDDVLSVFGLVSWEALQNLAGSVLRGDIAEIVKIIAELDQHGKDMHRLLLELLEYFRNLLVYGLAGKEAGFQNMTGQQLEVLEEQKDLARTERILEIVEILTETEGRLRFTLSKRTLFETALIRGARAATVVSIDEILKQLDALKKGLGPSGPPSDSAQKKTLDDSVPPAKPPASEPKATVPSPVPPGPPSAAPSLAPPARPASEEVAQLTASWDQIVHKVGLMAPLAKSYLLDAKPVRVEGSSVTVGFDPEFADNVEKIDFPRNIKAVKKALGDVLDRTVVVSFSVLEESEVLPRDTVVDPESEPEPSPESAPEPRSEPEPPLTNEREPVHSPPPQIDAAPPPRTGGRRNRQEWLKEPAVRKTLEAFNGEIVDIRD